MLKVDHAHWGQSVEDLRELSLHAGHARTRERFLALFMIASGQHTATSWAAAFGRAAVTVMQWVQLYNYGGPEEMAYRRSGGRVPLLRPPKPKSSSGS